MEWSDKCHPLIWGKDYRVFPPRKARFVQDLWVALILAFTLVSDCDGLLSKLWRPKQEVLSNGTRPGVFIANFLRIPGISGLNAHFAFFGGHFGIGCAAVSDGS